MYIDTRRETEVSIYSCIQRRTGVTLFHESIDRIALIARRVKLPRGRLLSSDLLECVACLCRDRENRAYTRQVFSARLASSWACTMDICVAMGGLTHVKERTTL